MSFFIRVLEHLQIVTIFIIIETVCNYYEKNIIYKNFSLKEIADDIRKVCLEANDILMILCQTCTDKRMVRSHKILYIKHYINLKNINILLLFEIKTEVTNHYLANCK